MRLPKRYLKRVLKKRLIEFVLMFSVISTVIFGVFMTKCRTGTGKLYQLGDDWFIGSNHHISYFFMDLHINNPDLFPHVLIPENNGTEVYYIHSTRDFYLCVVAPRSEIFITLDLIPVFIIKQAILYICIAIFSITVFPYLYLNRKKFPITNKLFG